MAEQYISDQAIADYQSQQLQRGEGLYAEDGGFQEISHRREIRRSKGYIPEASFNDAVSDITAEYEANIKAARAYEEMISQAEEISTQDDRFDPELEYYIDGQRVDDGSLDPEEDDDDTEQETEHDTDQDGAGDDDDDEAEDIWEDVVADDPSTWPDPDDVLDQLKEVSETFVPDPDAMREFRQLADYAESRGDYERMIVARACQKAHAGNWSIAQAYNHVVEEIGIQEALRIWVDLEANGIISF